MFRFLAALTLCHTGIKGNPMMFTDPEAVTTDANTCHMIMQRHHQQHNYIDSSATAAAPQPEITVIETSICNSSIHVGSQMILIPPKIIGLLLHHVLKCDKYKKILCMYNQRLKRYQHIVL